MPHISAKVRQQQSLTGRMCGDDSELGSRVVVPRDSTGDPGTSESRSNALKGPLDIQREAFIGMRLLVTSST